MTKIRSLKELKSKAFMSVDELYVDFNEVEKWAHEDLPKLVEMAVKEVCANDEKKKDYNDRWHTYVQFMPYDVANKFKRLLGMGIKR